LLLNGDAKNITLKAVAAIIIQFTKNQQDSILPLVAVKYSWVFTSKLPGEKGRN
jgi:hypothetical protein